MAPSFTRHRLTLAPEIRELALGEGHVDVDPFAHEIVAVEFFDSVLAVARVLVFDEAESRLQIDAFDLTVFAEEVVHVPLAHFVRDPSHVEL